MKYFLPLVFGFLLFSGCSRVQIATENDIPQESFSRKIVVYALENYTDTPQAGMRAANIAEGVLLARGFHVENRIDGVSLDMPLDEKIEDAKKSNSSYIFIGGVSEWRYKTGIDGEPAVSLQFKLIDVDTKKVVWSATGSDNDWGNASIGTTAQSLIESMIGTQVITENTKKQSNVKSQEVEAERLRLEREKKMRAKKELAIAKEKKQLDRLVKEVQAIEDKDVKNSDDYQVIVKKYKLIEDHEAKIAELEESLR